jgi:TolB protein
MGAFEMVSVTFFDWNCAALLTLFTTCLSAQALGQELTTSVDPGGCILEHVAVEPGTNQYQFDSLAPDGKSIAIAWDRGQDERGTYILDLETWQRQDIPALNNGATFSPDGRYLLNSVYVSDDNTDIARLDIDTGAVDIYAPNDAWDWLPSYSPDGSRILFNSFRTGNSDIYLYDLESEQLVRLTESAYYEAHAQFSPDGESILFHEQVSRSDFNVKLMNVASATAIDVTDGKSEDSYPSWSPDGKLIAFASDRNQETGITDIFIMTTSGEVQARITDAPHKDAYPFWSPDGSYLYFTSYREPQGVYRVRMTNLVECDRSQD